MKCPACNNNATTVLRDLFTLQGVTLARKSKGFFKCHRCGVLLRTTGYSKGIWYCYAAIAVALAVFVSCYQSWVRTIGTGATTAIWICLIMVIAVTVTYGLFKCAKIERAGDDSK
jgi:hypothetical protein